MTTARYEWPRSDMNHEASVGPACDSIRKAIRDLGFAEGRINKHVQAVAKEQERQKEQIDALSFLLVHFLPHLSWNISRVWQQMNLSTTKCILGSNVNSGTCGSCISFPRRTTSKYWECHMQEICETFSRCPSMVRCISAFEASTRHAPGHNGYVFDLREDFGPYSRPA